MGVRWMVELSLLEAHRISTSEERWEIFCGHYLMESPECWRKSPERIICVPLEVLRNYGMSRDLSVGELCGKRQVPVAVLPPPLLG